MSKGEEKRYEFKFSKAQIALLFAGIGIMAAVMFSLGTVVGKSLGEINTIISKPAPAPPSPAPAPAAPVVPAPQPAPPASVPAPQEAVPASPPTQAVPAQPNPAAPAPEQAKPPQEPPVVTAEKKATSEKQPVVAKSDERTADTAKGEKAGKEEPQTGQEPEKPLKQARKAAKKPAAKPVSTKAGKLAEDNTVPKKYMLQAGSFEGRTEADQLARKLRQKGFRATVYPIEIEGKGTWYRVRTGPYTTREAADKNLQKLQQINSLTPLLITAD